MTSRAKCDEIHSIDIVRYMDLGGPNCINLNFLAAKALYDTITTRLFEVYLVPPMNTLLVG